MIYPSQADYCVGGLCTQAGMLLLLSSSAGCVGSMDMTVKGQLLATQRVLSASPWKHARRCPSVRRDEADLGVQATAGGSSEDESQLAAMRAAEGPQQRRSCCARHPAAMHCMLSTLDSVLTASADELWVRQCWSHALHLYHQMTNALLT